MSVAAPSETGAVFKLALIREVLEEESGLGLCCTTPTSLGKQIPSHMEKEMFPKEKWISQTASTHS